MNKESPIKQTLVKGDTTVFKQISKLGMFPNISAELPDTHFEITF